MPDLAYDGVDPALRGNLKLRGNNHEFDRTKIRRQQWCGTRERIRNVAGIIAETYLQGNDVIVVLSAQGDTTDDLIAKAKEVNLHPSKREMDMLLSTGEQISVALCAGSLSNGIAVCILDRVAGRDSNHEGPFRCQNQENRHGANKSELDQHRIVLVTGFQGVDRLGDVTTLGRGGSDTSAVALGSGLSGRFVPNLHGCGRRLYHRPAHRPQREKAG